MVPNFPGSAYTTCSGVFFLTNNHPSALHYLPESKFLSNHNPNRDLSWIPMARITEDVEIETQWSLSKDIVWLKKKVDWAAKGMATRRYIVIGETHTSPYDKARNLAVVEEFRRDGRVILVVERGMFDALDQQYIGLSESVITEKNLKLVSSSPHRKRLIVEQLLVEIAKDKPYS